MPGSRRVAGLLVGQISHKAAPLVRIEAATGSGTRDLCRVVANEEQACEMPQGHHRVIAAGGEGNGLALGRSSE